MISRLAIKRQYLEKFEAFENFKYSLKMHVLRDKTTWETENILKLNSVKTTLSIFLRYS
jgi:hypothetical protein